MMAADPEPDPTRMVHLQVQVDGTVSVGLPDRDTGMLTTVEMTAATARALGSELFKAGCAGEVLEAGEEQPPPPV